MTTSDDAATRWGRVGKRFRRSIGLGVGLVLATSAVASYQDFQFETLGQAMVALTAEPNMLPLDLPRRYRGVIHVHSNASHDSAGDPAEIIAAAKAAGLDFVMMTDHNSRAIFDQGFDGWRDGVLVIRGAEFRAEKDYVLGLGLRSFIDSSRLTFRQVTEAIVAQGGVAIGAHPNWFRHWSDPGLSGVEVWDLYDEVRSAPWRYPGLVVDALLSYEEYLDEPVFHERWASAQGSGAFDAAILESLIRPPDRALAAFDAEAARRHFVAVGAPDTHKKNIRLLDHADPYALTLGLATTYLLADEFTQAALLDALRRGRSYLAFDRLAPASGFDVRVIDGANGVWGIGDTVGSTEHLTLRVTAPHPGRITVIRDGAVVSRSDASTVAVPVVGPGVYRAEVALLVEGRWRPWIYSNPIYVR